MAEPTPKPPDAPPKESKPVKESKPLPLPIHEVLGTPQEAVVRNWNAQAKAGIIHQCREEGCYFPLVPLRDTNRNPVGFRNEIKTKNGKVLVEMFTVMTCSYHPEHGSTISIPKGVSVHVGPDRVTSVVGFKVKTQAAKDDDLDVVA